MKSLIKLAIRLLAVFFPNRFVMSEVPLPCAGNERAQPLRSVSWNIVLWGSKK